MPHPNDEPSTRRIRAPRGTGPALVTGLLLLSGCQHGKRIAALEDHVAQLQAEMQQREADIAVLESRLDAATDAQVDNAGRLDALDRMVLADREDFHAHHQDVDLAMSRVYRELRAQQSWWRYTHTRLGGVEARLGIEAPPPPEGPSTTEIPDAGEPTALTRLVRQHLDQGEHATARELLRAGMERLGDDHEGLAELRYLDGEAWFGEGRWGQAASVYQLVTEAHADTPWAAWAMVRMGQCFDAMGERETAHIYFEDVLEHHPDSPAAETARALVDPEPANR